MNLRRAFAITASLAALALSCKTPTQITVVLKGRGIACEEAAGGEAPLLGGDPVFDESGVVASTAIGFGGGGPEVGAKKTDRCLVAVDGRADLGEVVLLPGSSGGAVEVLAIAVVDGTSDSAAAPSSVEDCLVEYQRLLDPAEKCTVDDACVGCIFASRSLEFVDATRLTLEIELSTACAGVFCEPGSTCVEGECVSSSCPAGANECAVGVGGQRRRGGRGRRRSGGRRPRRRSGR